MMVTSDGHSRLELSQFISPQVVADYRMTPVNSLGYQCLMFRVDNLEELLDRLLKQLCYIRGVEGLLIGLAEQLGDLTTKDIVE